MNRTIRTAILLLTSGVVWRCCMKLLFISSGAQQILANPLYQSSKFLKVFMEYEPLPRMAADSSIVWKGFFVCGLFIATAFIIISPHIQGHWLRRAYTFGFVQWLLMVPWFEFYLPYNVMHEPLALVLLESLLWLVTIALTALYMSFIMYYGNENKTEVNKAASGTKVYELPVKPNGGK